jgi:hypothetical protein
MVSLKVLFCTTIISETNFKMFSTLLASLIPAYLPSGGAAANTQRHKKEKALYATLFL